LLLHGQNSTLEVKLAIFTSLSDQFVSVSDDAILLSCGHLPVRNVLLDPVVYSLLKLFFGQLTIVLLDLKLVLVISE
jgi:hypothetical protein